MSECKLIVTTECNFNCSYCCNKIPEIQSKFKMSTFMEVVDKYDVYNITGGEIGLVPSKVMNLCNVIKRKNKNAKIYLYTNGMLRMNDTLSSLVDGINIGIHKETRWFEVQEYLEYKNKVTLSIQDKLFESYDDISKKTLAKNFKIRLWKMNECGINNNVDWLII